MVAEIKLYTNKKFKKGYPVVFYFRNASIRKPISLGWFFEKHEWNFDLNEPFSSAKDYKYIYPVLMNYKHKIKHLLFKGETDLNAYLLALNIDNGSEIELLQKRLAELQNESKVGILEFFDIMIAEKKQKRESIRFYEKTKDQFETYLVKDVPLNVIDYTWLNNFILYKKQQGTGDAGIMAYLRTLRAVFKEAQKRPYLNVKKENPFVGVIKTIASNKVYEFTTTDFKKLLNYTPHKFTKKTVIEQNKRAVRLWLFQFVIGGHDIVDVANLSWKNYKNNRLQFKRYKNRNKPNGGVVVNNKVLPYAKWFIKHYATPENERMFGFIPAPENETRYRTFRGNYLRTLKTVSKSLNLTTAINSKTPRYVFRTLGGELLINDLILMQLQGHKPTGVTFSYQNSLPTSVIDVHHKAIVERVGVTQG